MCSKLHNFTDNGEPVGVFMAGGTESILMAILAFREYGRSKGITKPNLLICYTGHVASIKACKYFDIEIRFVDYDEDYRMSIADTKRKIDYNTIGVYTSCPNYPYGTIDPIQEIAGYCKTKDIPVHIDMCLGGFLVPFIKNDKGEPMFTIPDGVTTISMDPHKFGLAGKGASVLLYSSQKMRCHQFFSTSYWPGGLYGTVGIAGSRSGGGIASSWISMMRMGTNGYRESAEKVQSGTK
jgi:sphinganine-1-phosphate aldolase